MKEDVFVCPSCPPENRKRMHLCDLREHIAEKHLDNFHVFHCPKCNKKFATSLQAHKHIREVCKITGIIPMQNYTTAILSYDATYVNKMYKIELASIFRYVMACTKNTRPSANIGINTDPVETTSVELLANMEDSPESKRKPSKPKSKRHSRSSTELEDDLSSKSFPGNRSSRDSATKIGSDENKPDFLSEMASPGVVKDETMKNQRAGSPESFGRSIDAEPPSECGDDESDFLDIFSVKREPEERSEESSSNNGTASKASFGNNDKGRSRKSPQESVPESVTKVPLLIPKKEPVDAEEERETKCSWRPFKKEPEAEEIPPPASPESFSDSIDLDQHSPYRPPSECGDPASSIQRPSSIELGYQPISSPVYQDPFFCNFIDPNAHLFHSGGTPSSHISSASEKVAHAESVRFREQCESLAKKYIEKNQQREHSETSHRSSNRDPRLRREEKPCHKRKPSRDRKESKPTASSSKAEHDRSKVIVRNSRYHRIIRKDHVCEYEECCDTSVNLHCTFCNGGHGTLNCAVFPTYEDRMAEANRQKICLRCGLIHDYQNNCSGVRCYYCNNVGHYAAFCHLEKSKNIAKKRAYTYFSKWLPNIPELEALKRKRRERVSERRVHEHTNESARKKRSRSRRRRSYANEDTRTTDSKRQRRHDD